MYCLQPTPICINLEPKSSTNLTFNSSSGALAASSFVGDVVGDYGDVTVVVCIQGHVQAILTATTATNVTVTDESSDLSL